MKPLIESTEAHWGLNNDRTIKWGCVVVTMADTVMHSGTMVMRRRVSLHLGKLCSVYNKYEVEQNILIGHMETLESNYIERRERNSVWKKHTQTVFSYLFTQPKTGSQMTCFNIIIWTSAVRPYSSCTEQNGHIQVCNIVAWLFGQIDTLLLYCIFRDTPAYH